MRRVDLTRSLSAAIAYVLVSLPLGAFEIEDRRQYPGTGPDMVRVISTADLDVFEPFHVLLLEAMPK